MAHIQIESGFDPSIKASDFATTGSVGLMQVAAPTLGDIKRDYPAAANTLALSQTDPLASICAGMLYLRTCYNYLLPIFKAPLAYRHVCVAYNEGPGNAGKGIADAAYYIKWRLSAAEVCVSRRARHDGVRWIRPASPPVWKEPGTRSARGAPFCGAVAVGCGSSAPSRRCEA